MYMYQPLWGSTLGSGRVGINIPLLDPAGIFLKCLYQRTLSLVKYGKPILHAVTIIWYYSISDVLKLVILFGI